MFANVPYLNSSLFEPTDIEHICFTISQLKDGKLPVLSNSVIKDATGKKRTGEMTTVEYLFEFLNAYDFSSEGSEEIQEDNKRLINASVLGLIFEKINGYKDGSFFTPGFITMYMCRETIRRAVMQKFNETKGWNCADLHELYDKIEDRKEANTIINSLKLCDPAVGSGHFLVSALNEIIAIKSELRILSDREGKRLKEYRVEVENDELIVTDEDGHLFEYNPLSKESQRVQETLFHEKQTIIENCLFGVDLNPNSVKICRLRLWIELLKNAYYRSADIVETQCIASLRGERELETLPNIDINIKCGNSLISRYALDTDIKSLLKTSNWTINSYRKAVDNYRNAKTKDEKRLMESLILRIKQDFSSEIKRTDPLITKLNKLASDFYNRFSGNFLFESTEPYSKKEKELEKKKIQEEKTAKKVLEELEKVIDDRKNNIIFDRSFEWRFEFPEVLNDDGDFIGFDVVIGNPPYIRQEEINEQKGFFKDNYSTYTGTSDLYVFFVEKAFDILKTQGQFSYIMPNKWMQSGYGKPLRSLFLNYKLHLVIDFGDLQVFDEATTYPCIINASKEKMGDSFKSIVVKTLDYESGFEQYMESVYSKIDTTELNSDTWLISSNEDQNLLAKLKNNSVSLSEYVNGTAKRGVVTGLTEAFVIDEGLRNKFIELDSNNIEIIKPLLQGRDLKPYSSKMPDKYLLYIPWHFPLNNDLSINGASFKAIVRYKLKQIPDNQ